MMMRGIQTWIHSIPLTDEIERRQAHIFQALLLIWISLTSVGLPALWLPFFFPPAGTVVPPPESIPPIFFWILALNMVAGLLLWLTPTVALVMLRRGNLSRSVGLAISGLLFSHSLATLLLGITEPSVTFLYAVPLTMAGLLGGRRLLLRVAWVSIAVALASGALQLQRLAASPPPAGSVTPSVTATLGFFVAIVILITFLLDRFGAAFRDSLRQALAREEELIALRNSLEAKIVERTIALRHALDESQARAEAQSQLLEEIQRQQEVIRDLSIPVIPVSEQALVIPLVGALDSSRLRQMQQQALRAIETTRARVLILDVTGVALIDSQVAQGLIQTITAARLLGAQVMLVGIRPEVAQTMVGIGVDLPQIPTFSILQAALASADIHLSRVGRRVA